MFGYMPETQSCASQNIELSLSSSNTGNEAVPLADNLKDLILFDEEDQIVFVEYKKAMNLTFYIMGMVEVS